MATNAFNTSTGQRGYLVPDQKAPTGWSFDSGVSAPAPVSSPTPTPTPTTDSPTLVDRYATDKSNLESVYGLTQNPDENAIRTQQRNAAQASIDAINAKYAKIDQADQDTIDLMNRERRASNVLNGLSGSDVGAARTVETAKQGDKIKDLTAQGKNAELQTVLSNADTRASDEFAKQKADYIANAKDKLTAEQALQDRIDKNARAELTTLASSLSYSELKPNQIAQYMKETGMDSTALKAYFLSQSKANLLSDKPEIMGNKAIWFQRKSDGTIGQISVDLPAGSSKIKDSRITDGGLQVLYENGTYKVIGIPGSNTDASTIRLHNAQADALGQGSGGYVMPKAAKNNLMKYGYSSSDVNKIETDIKQYGLTKVLEGIPNDQKTIVQNQLDQTYTTDLLGGSLGQ